MRPRAAIVCLGAAAAVGLAARAPASGLPPPAFGRTLDVGLVSGTVIITPPGQHPFTLGTVDRNIPIGSLINTSHGRIDLRAAPPPGSAGAAAQPAVEDAQFYDGVFTVHQSPGALVTLVTLAGGSFSSCSAPSAARLSHRVIRLLWASGPGRFTTRGRYGAATVLGTVWLTEDYCDGTLVRVRRGVVSVKNLVTGASIKLTPGQSYFAQAP